MTIRRPLNFTSDSLQELSDDQLNMLAYLVRKAYAYKMFNDSTYSGYVTSATSSPGVEFTNIGNFTNTYRTLYADYEADINTYPPDQDDDPSDFQDGSTQEYYSYKTAYQRQGIPGWITDSTIHDNYGYLYYNTTDDVLTYPTSETDLRDTIITTALTQLQTGDEVGSYRVATSSPGSDWSQRSVFLTDTVFNFSLHYYLYVRMKNSTYESTDGSNNVPIVRWDGSNFKEISIDIDNPQDNDLISNILLPGLSRIAPKYILEEDYTTNGVSSGQVLRGLIYDKKYSGSTLVITGPTSGFYTGTFTPSGGTTTIMDYAFKLVERP